jgi:hypothetical protein
MISIALSRLLAVLAGGELHVQVAQDYQERLFDGFSLLMVRSFDIVRSRPCRFVNISCVEKTVPGSGRWREEALVQAALQGPVGLGGTTARLPGFPTLKWIAQFVRK